MACLTCSLCWVLLVSVRNVLASWQHASAWREAVGDLFLWSCNVSLAAMAELAWASYCSGHSCFERTSIEDVAGLCGSTLVALRSEKHARSSFKSLSSRQLCSSDIECTADSLSCRGLRSGLFAPPSHAGSGPIRVLCEASLPRANARQSNIGLEPGRRHTDRRYVITVYSAVGMPACGLGNRMSAMSRLRSTVSPKRDFRVGNLRFACPPKRRADARLRG